MCSGLPGQRCGVLGFCIDGSDLVSCQIVGNRCYNCWTSVISGDAKTAEPTHFLMLYNEHNQLVASIVKRPGAAGGDDPTIHLQPFDEVEQVNGVKADMDCIEQLAKVEGQPMGFTLTVWREGKVVELKFGRI